HFWSLSVEEQFYVFWPWVVLFAPRRMLKSLAVLMIAIAPAYKLSYVLSQYTNMTALSSFISTWSSLDSLGMGALLAMARRTVSPQPEARAWRILLPVALIALAALQFGGNREVLLFHDSAQAVVACWIVARASRGFGGVVARVLESAPAVYTGKISYGVY